MITVVSLQSTALPQAARLWVQSFCALRQTVPLLPDPLENPARVEKILSRLLARVAGVAAYDGAELVGYLLWVEVENFRDAGRKAAYCPEWAHAAAGEDPEAVYRALYQVAAACWAADGCQVHAITLLAHQPAVERAWYWNGFGLAVVDAVRPVQPFENAMPAGIVVRKATTADVDAIVSLDARLSHHTSQPPILMPFRQPLTAQGNLEFMSRPKNRVWLAFYGELPVGFMRFDGYDYDGVAILEADTTVTITGAYVLPQQRGQGIASALLSHALKASTDQGFRCCAVNFESFNPEASAFWMRYFQPVCLSLMRVPETVP